MTSLRELLTWLLTSLVPISVAGYDASVCVPSVAVVPLPAPAAALGQVWQAEMEWKDDVRNRTYVIKDYADMPEKKEKLVISIPLRDDVTLLYDWNTLDVIVEETMRITPTESRLYCRVLEHSNTGEAFALTDEFGDKFWLTSLQVLMQKFTDSRDAVLKGSTVVRGIKAQQWSACIYDFYRNSTMKANLYFSDPSWLSPYLPPDTRVPIRLEYVGRQHNGSDVTEISLKGDVTSFKKREPDDRFPPDTFTTRAGAFCPGRTGVSMRFPSFPPGLSLLMEVIDLDFTRVSYEELWYDRALNKARLDSKLVFGGGDSDPSSYIFDFNAGVKYIIDKYLMVCSVTPLGSGDDFATMLTNGTLAMMTADRYFHASHGTTVQYAGQATVREVVCDTWVGRYFDPSTNRNTTVQWYFTARNWIEATGTVEGAGAFFMMKVWKGGSGNPTIYNVMQYRSIAPDFTVFDVNACYGYNAKKHFTIEFHVSDIAKMSGVSLPYVKLFLVQKLAQRLQVQLNRFADISLDTDSGSSSLFMSSTLLDAMQGNSGWPEITLEAAFVFLHGSIDVSHLAFNLSAPAGVITLTGISLVEHNFRKEFATTTTPLPTTRKFVAPTLVPPKKPSPVITPSRSPTTLTPASCSCPASSPAPSCPACPTPPPCPSPSSPPSYPPLPSRRTCPPAIRPSRKCSCPSPKPATCPPRAPCLTTRQGQRGRVTSGRFPEAGSGSPCTCPSPSSPVSCSGNGKQAASSSSSSDSGISVGALAGGVVAALVLGLALGIIATRFYHLMRVNPEQMTINLIEDNI